MKSAVQTNQRPMSLSLDTLPVPAMSPVHAWLNALTTAAARAPLAHRLMSTLLMLGLPGLGVYASLVEPVWLRVKRLEVPLANLPLGLDGLRIVHLSDLHIGSEVPAWFLRNVMTTVQELAPDLIVLTGDFVHSDPSESHELPQLLQALRAPYGVFAVLGNHDYAMNCPGVTQATGVEEVVITALERAGIVVLRNEEAEIVAGRNRLALYGIDEFWSGRAQVSFLHEQSPTRSHVVLCHNPDVVQFLPEENSDLVLCGHTHGGQVRIPPFRPLVTMTADQRYWGGLTARGNGWVFVSRGIGYTWRVRLAARPECVEITLRRGE